MTDEPYQITERGDPRDRIANPQEMKGCGTHIGRVPPGEGRDYPAEHAPGTGSLGPGRCAVCGTPWVWSVARRLWVAACECERP